jgi:hypothetical protein
MIIRNKFNGYSGDGRRLYPGGGGGQAPPAQQAVSQTTIPEYAKPYVERLLGQAEKFADPNRKLETYGRERIAPFSDLQQRYFAAASQLGPTQQIGEASGIASDVASRAGQMGYQPQYFGNQYRAPGQFRPGQFGVMGVGTSSFTQPGAASAFMSPYQQAVTNIEKREATRASDILRQQQQAQAVQQGAFGGSRQALIEAERQRNLGMQLGDIQARGGQAAFDRATQQFNAEQAARLQAQLANQQAYMQAQQGTEQSRQFGYGQGMTAAEQAARYGLSAQQAAEQSRQFGATYGMDALRQQLAASQQLGGLGQAEFAQQQQAMQALAGAGAQQQAQRQQQLTQDYQDFLSQRGQPFQQLAFMSDILRGGPLSQTTYQMYQAPPSMASQAAQFGLGAYGLSQLGQSGLFKKEGGMVKGYAGGGIASVGTPYDVPPDKLMNMVKKMSSDQLQAIGGNTDNAVTLGIVNAEMNRRQIMREGKALAEQVPEGTVRDAMMGIDEVPLDPRMFADTAVGEVPEPEMARGGVVAFAKGDRVQAKPDYISEFAAMDPSKIFAAPEERIAASEAGLKRYKEYVGSDESIPAMQEFSKSLALTPEERASQRAGIALKAASKFGRRGKTFEEEAGEAFGVAAEEGEQAMKLDREIKRQQKLLDIDVKKAQRAEKRNEWDMFEKYGEKADAKAEKIAGLKMDQAKVLSEAQLKREGYDKQLEAARISAGPGYAAANKPTDFRTAQSAFMGQAMADFRAKNPGRQPTELELATMNKQATVDAGNLMKQYAGDINRDKLAVAAQEKAAKQASDELDNNTKLVSRLRKEDKEKGLAPGTSQQVWLRNREQEILAGGGGGAGAGGAGATPVQGALPMPANKAGLEKGLIYNTARGPARWNGAAFEAI